MWPLNEAKVIIWGGRPTGARRWKKHRQWRRGVCLLLMSLFCAFTPGVGRGWLGAVPASAEHQDGCEDEGLPSNPGSALLPA